MLSAGRTGVSTFGFLRRPNRQRERIFVSILLCSLFYCTDQTLTDFSATGKSAQPSFLIVTIEELFPKQSLNSLPAQFSPTYMRFEFAWSLLMMTAIGCSLSFPERVQAIQCSSSK